MYSATSPGVGGGGDEASRLRGVCIVKGILFGNVSHHLGKKRELDGHTHEWKVYVKPVDNEDMSPYVKKVQFRLHESYANQNRIVSKPPYEVSESGWGEFEIQIRIHFNDANEKPVTFYHVLKLFHNSSSGGGGGGTGEGGSGSSNVPHGGTTTAVIQGRKSVISECYDEILFQDPTHYLYTLVTNTRRLTMYAHKHDTNVEERKERTLAKIREGKVRTREEIADFKVKLELARETIAKFKAEIGKVQDQDDS